MTLYSFKRRTLTHPWRTSLGLTRAFSGRRWLSWQAGGKLCLRRTEAFTSTWNNCGRRRPTRSPLTEKGWQEAFQAIYPLKINELRVVDGEFTYVDKGPFEPLKVTKVNLTADNIRNIRSQAREYPSPVHLDAVVFDTGRVVLDGHADFLAEPHLGIKANVALEGIALDYFKPITNRYNVTVRKGVLSANGLVEYAPAMKVLDLESAAVRDLQVEYTHTPAKKGVVRRPPPRPPRRLGRSAMSPASSCAPRNSRLPIAPWASSTRR